MKQQLSQAVSDCIKQLYNIEAEAELSRPEEKFGDYATNIALRMSKQLGRSPREAAEEVAARLRVDLAGSVSDISIAGPGFINLTVCPEFLLSSIGKPHKTSLYDSKKVVIETNNPNPFKAMHIGHAFNAILGDTIANLLVVGGADTHRVSYHGDVGSHVGKSMWAILKHIDGDVAKLHALPAAERNAFMSKMYAEGAAAYNDDVAAKEAINLLAEQSFTLEDSLYREVYETCKAWSFELLEITIARLGCQPTERKYLESEADAMGVKTVLAHADNVFTESDGAYIFEGEEHGVYTNVFVSSKGRGLYAARDLGLMQLKQTEYHPGKSYIVTAVEQRDYFRGVFKAAELCLPELTGVTVNISTGTVKLATGKMSSRTGDVLDVAWLFEQVENAVRARGGEPARDVVIGSLRYQFLKVRIGSDVVFDVNEAVALAGNSGPYLQYAHARARSIMAKAPASQPDLTADLEAAERSLLRKISEYPEVVDTAVRELMPHHICTYLYELAQTFNSFYEHNRVIGHEREAQRLALVTIYADTLKHGLELLGIPAPQSM